MRTDQQRQHYQELPVNNKDLPRSVFVPHRPDSPQTVWYLCELSQRVFGGVGVVLSQHVEPVHDHQQPT